jgi:uncharacterized protein (DUF2062 family)
VDRAKARLLAFLTAGITPEQLAFCIALGIVLGIVPALGTATLLCTGAAFLFRLNFAAIQLVNFVIYPVQLALLIPFVRAGEWLFGAQHLELSVEKIQEMLKVDVWATVFSLWATTLRAIAAWLLIAPVVLGLAYWGLVPLMRKLKVDRILASSVPENRS